MKNANFHILVIEDERDLKNTLFDILNISGYQVSTTSDGQEGYRAILALQPDLVICDVNMPEMDGYEVLQALNTRLKKEQIPAFLFLTAFVQFDDIKRGLELGADEYITKPFDIKYLLKVVEERLKKREIILEDN